MKKTLLTLFAVAMFGVTAAAQTVADIVGNYKGILYISFEPISEESEPMGEQTISLTEGENGTLNFTLPNFSFGDMVLGDIQINQLPMTFVGNYATFGEHAPVSLVFNEGKDDEIRATAQINVAESNIRGERVNVDLHVMWTNVPGSTEPMPIYVKFDGYKEYQKPLVSIKDIVGSYDGDLYISLADPINDEIEPIPAQKVRLEAASENAVNFTLPNFSFDAMELGDIAISDIAVNFNGTTTSFSEKEPVELVFNEGTDIEIRATAQMDVAFSSIWGNAIDVYLNVMWTNVPGGGEMPIYVRFIGKNTAAGIDGVTTTRPAAEGVYSIDGRFVGKELHNGLTRGIYVVGGQKVLKK